mmetsp:Transcript_10925/g.22686  ORF Transcript_10925/g.22686 Transcript_10925/m.22686 type:complete len:148 (-) Transcript_10925:689-1132(-)
MNPSQLSLVVALVAAFTVFTVVDAFVSIQQPRGTARKIHRNQLLQIRNSNAGIDTMALRSNPSDIEEDESEDERIETVDNDSEKSLFDKVNDFLDTPILDANNRSDQGALAETLKDFVRDEPELAQVTFSVLVVVILALVTRTIMSF